MMQAPASVDCQTAGSNLHHSLRSGWMFQASNQRMGGCVFSICFLPEYHFVRSCSIHCRADWGLSYTSS
jgi:hypothetical protein